MRFRQLRHHQDSKKMISSYSVLYKKNKSQLSRQKIEKRVVHTQADLIRNKNHR